MNDSLSMVRIKESKCDLFSLFFQSLCKPGSYHWEKKTQEGKSRIEYSVDTELDSDSTGYTSKAQEGSKCSIQKKSEKGSQREKVTLGKVKVKDWRGHKKRERRKTSKRPKTCSIESMKQMKKVYLFTWSSEPKWNVSKHPNERLFKPRMGKWRTNNKILLAKANDKSIEWLAFSPWKMSQ